MEGRRADSGNRRAATPVVATQGAESGRHILLSGRLVESIKGMYLGVQRVKEPFCAPLSQLS